MAISELGGRQMRGSDVTVNVPHVVKKLWELMKELIDGFGKTGDRVMGNNKFCNIRYLFAHPGLGMTDMGDDWNGPMRTLIVAFEAGPMYLPVWISL